MRSSLRRKYKPVRMQFKKDLYERARENKALPVMILKTYTASQHRTHIGRIWQLLGFSHPVAHKDYCEKLFGSHLTGRDEMMHSLHFAEPDLWEKYWRKIPECVAMGDALAVAYRVLKEAKE